MPSEKTDDLAMLIMSAGRLLHQCLARSAGDKISLLHIKILAFVSDKRNPTMKDIAGYLGITAPSATVIVNRLVRSGELKRMPGRIDRRKVQIALTRKGASDLRRGHRLSLHVLKSELVKLTSNEQHQLAVILKKLTKQK